MGTIYKRGKTYWVKYYRSRKPFYESSGSSKKMVADRLLKRREGDISQGKAPGVHFEKITFCELAEDFLTDYRINSKKSLDRPERSVKRLRRWFEGVKAVNINTASIKSYIQARIDEGAENASVNRELAALKRMFNLGASCTSLKVDCVPYAPSLKENNTR